MLIRQFSEEGYVLCPICEKEMKLEKINAHIDRGCQDEPRITKPGIGRATKKPQSAASLPEKPIKRPERLAQLHYGGLKDTALRKKLTDLGLSAAGSRQLLEKRYTEWVTLWNANCDATRPRSKGELKRELDIWERTQGGMTPASSSTQNPGAQIKNKDFNSAAWSSKHDDSFRDLIAAARKKVAAKPQTPESALNTAGPSEAQTPMVGGVAASPGVPPVDVEMVEVADPQTGLERVEDSPVKQDASERRFFLENDTPQPAPHNSAVASPSQYPTNMPKLDRGMGSDMTTIIQSSQ
jgi:E3 ubiquitin-protein ligase RAD18